MSKKVEKYFRHDNNARNDMKIIEIRRKYGSKGYGIYFMLIEMLNSTDCYELAINYPSLSFDIREDEETIKDIVENFKLFKVKNDVFYSESLKKRMIALDKFVDKKQKAGRKGAENRWTKSSNSKLPPKL